MSQYSEQRRVRFACIDGIDREDLSLAGEIWRDDVISAPWADRSAMKIANHLALYMGYPNADSLVVAAISERYRLTEEEVGEGLALLSNYGAVNSFAIDDGRIRAALNLTMMQRLRVLEAKSRFLKLLGRCPDMVSSEASWLAQRAPASPSMRLPDRGTHRIDSNQR